MASAQVRKYLKENGVSTGSDIAAHFVNREGIKSSAARKRVQRAKDENDILVLKGIALTGNVSILYLRNSFGSPLFWEQLLKVLSEAQSSYARAIHSLRARGGVARYEERYLFTGSPARLKKHISADRIVEDLLRIEMIEKQPAKGDTFALELVPNAAGGGAANHSHARARSIAEGVLLKGLRDWSRKMSLVSYNKVEINRGTGEKLPRFGQFDWGLAGPSYAYPLVEPSQKKKTPGFFVADVLLGGVLSEDEVRYFVEKCRMTRSAGKPRPFMAMLVASEFEDSAFRLGKTEGLLFVTPENLFGSKVAEALRQLLLTLENAAAVASKNPHQISELFGKLSAIEGAAQSIRGPLFELIVAHCVYKLTGGLIEVGKRLRLQSGQEVEIDVWCRDPSGQRVMAIEAKGERPGGAVSLDEAEKWLTKTVPTARKWMLEQAGYRNMDMHFEIWTSGGFNSEALSFLEEQKEAISETRYTIDFKNGRDSREAVREADAKHLENALKEHYQAHPLA